MSGASGFAFTVGESDYAPMGVVALRDGRAVATGPLPATKTRDGLDVYGFLAGAAADHLVAVTQRWTAPGSDPAPANPQEAFVSRWTEESSWACELQFADVTQLTAAALVPGRLVVGSFAVKDRQRYAGVTAFTVTAYDLPGEALAPTGWVQSTFGSPGHGFRPLR